MQKLSDITIGKEYIVKSINDDELAQHVSSMYMRGPGGKMRQVDIKRKRMEAASNLDVDMTEREHRAYMSKLDRHPALVLNADFQVCSIISFLVFGAFSILPKNRNDC